MEPIILLTSLHKICRSDSMSVQIADPKIADCLNGRSDDLLGPPEINVHIPHILSIIDYKHSC